MAVREYSKGKWAASYYVKNEKGKNIKRVRKGFKSKKEAEEYEELHKGLVETTQSKYKFSKMFEEMSNANRANKVTTSTRRQRLKTYAPDIWCKPMNELTKEYLLKWRNDIAKGTLSTATKNDIIGYIKQVFKYAYEVYDIYDSAKILKTFPKQLEDIKSPNIINYSEFQKLEDAEDIFVLKVFFRFLFMTGCRKGEARALYKEDFDGKCVHIYKSMRRYDESMHPTKTRTQRWVYLDDETIEMVKELMKYDGKYLFGGRSPLSLTTISDHFNEDLLKANLPHMRIHDLRHSNVSMLWAAGVPIPEISKRIGHSTPKVTMDVYAHIFDNKQEASLSFLNSLSKK